MKFVAIGLIVLVAAPALAGGPTYTRGYTRSNGTYVAPHYSSAPDSTKTNNWSSKGNINPYTGEAGTKDPYAPSTTYKPYQPYQPYDPYKH